MARGRGRTTVFGGVWALMPRVVKVVARGVARGVVDVVMTVAGLVVIVRWLGGIVRVVSRGRVVKDVRIVVGARRHRVLTEVSVSVSMMSIGRGGRSAMHWFLERVYRLVCVLGTGGNGNVFTTGITLTRVGCVFTRDRCPGTFGWLNNALHVIVTVLGLMA